MFFKPETEDQVAIGLYRSILKDLNPEDTIALWKLDEEKWQDNVKRPFHESLTSDNKNEEPEAPNVVKGSHVAGMAIAGPHLADDGPESFKTAPEYPVSSPAPTPKMNGTKQSQDIDQVAPVTVQPAKQLPLPLKSPPRKNIEQSNGDLTTSNLSVSSSSQGKRQRAMESIGKFRRSLTSGLSKLGSHGRDSGP